MLDDQVLDDQVLADQVLADQGLDEGLDEGLDDGGQRWHRQSRPSALLPSIKEGMGSPMPTEITTPGVYVQELPSRRRPVTPVETAITAFVGAAAQGPVDAATSIQSFVDFMTVFGDAGLSWPMSQQVRQFFVNGGQKAVIVRVAPAVAGATADGPAGAGPAADAGICGNRERRTGIYALETVDQFNLLCLCPAAPSPAGTSPAEASPAEASPAGTSYVDLAPTTWAIAADYCRDRRAMLLVDAPAAWITAADPAAAAIAGFDALRASIAATENAALFFPYLNLVGIEGPAPGEERVLTVAPSGSVAGIIARLDGWSGVWNAPAGPAASLNAVTDLSTRLTDQQADALNRLGINCLRGFAGKGNLVWGSRTLQGAADYASEWKYIQVRRLALFIEESIRRNIGWVAFEPNDAQLWSALRDEVGSFLQDLFSKGAFQGLAAQDGYFVKCDASTTTQSDVDAGEVNIIIGFAPLKPAEFVVISLTQIADTCA